MDLRSSLLGSGAKDHKVIDIVIGSKEMKVEVRRPSLADRDNIFAKSIPESSMKKNQFIPNGNESIVWGIIYQTYVPHPTEDDNPNDEMFKNAGNRVFEDADFDIIYAMPLHTPFVDRISDITTSFLMVDEDEIKKN